jgi:hypothetical protein
MNYNQLDYQLIQEFFKNDADRYNEFLAAFEKNKDVLTLRRKKRDYLKDGNYMRATYTEAAIQKLKKDAAKILFNDTQRDLEKINGNEKLRDLLEENAVVMCMLTDMLEQTEIKIKDALGEQGINDISFGDHLKVIKSCRAQLKWLYNISILLDNDSWGESCDKLLGMVENKAKKLIDKCYKNAKREKSAPVSTGGC